MIATLRDSLFQALEDTTQKLGDYARSTPLQDFEGKIIEFDHHDEAYITIDIKHKNIFWKYRVGERLGHDIPDEADMRYLDQYVLAWIKPWFQALMAAGLTVFLDKGVNYIGYHFGITVPMQMGDDGSFKTVKILTMPYDRDKQKLPVTFMQSFFIVQGYNADAVGLEVGWPQKLKPEELILAIQQAKEIEAAIWQHMAKHIPRGTKGLTKNQVPLMTVIRKWQRENPDLDIINLSEEKIASELHGRTVENGSIEARRTGRAMSDFKERLLEWVLDPDLINEDKTNIFLKTTKYKPIEVINWCEQSKIITLMGEYKGSPRKKSSQI